MKNKVLKIDWIKTSEELPKKGSKLLCVWRDGDFNNEVFYCHELKCWMEKQYYPIHGDQMSPIKCKEPQYWLPFPTNTPKDSNDADPT